VIGSGIGGLTAASILAKVGGKKVLVLEQHVQPGGLTHVFRRQGASWDVGLHYVGEMSEGTMPRTLMDLVTGGEVKWRPMPDEFEHFSLPGYDLKQPSNPALWQRRLEEAFPHEKKGIRRWYRELRKMRGWVRLGFMANLVPAPVSSVLTALVKGGRGKAARTTLSVLDQCVSDPALRNLLTAFNGDYGLPPEEAAFAIHALVQGHYTHGAYFPEGGSGRIARAAAEGIEARGGLVLTGWKAVEILRDTKGAACGVRAVDVGNGTGRELTFESAIVISAIGVKPTLNHLLKGALPPEMAALQQQVNTVPPGYSAVTLYLKLKRSAQELGVHGENWWVYAKDQQSSFAAQAKAAFDGHPEHVYVSFPSLKNGEERFHTAEIIAPALWSHFSRADGYEAAKVRIAAGLLATAERALPGLTALVDYQELSTPLTLEQYLQSERGQFYGLPARPERYAISGLTPKTAIPGLYLAGTDAASLGITGALMGGAGCALTLLGSRGMPMMLAASKANGVAPRARATLRSLSWKSTEVVAVSFAVDRSWEFRPGQYARLEVAPLEWRDYSLVDVRPTDGGCEAEFLISVATGGDGSQWFRRAQVGDSLRIEGPMGIFALSGTSRRKVYVGTGTGLAPLLAMHRREPGTVVFGCRTPADNLAESVAGAVVCTSRAAGTGFAGRVTAFLETLPFDPAQTEFYLCGSPAMVTDVTALLKSRGSTAIFTETW